MRIGFYVQHLLGLGHLRRACLICEAFADAGHEVVLYSGGRSVPQLMPEQVELVQLPSLHVGTDGWRDLRDEDGDRVDETWLDKRRNQLLEDVSTRDFDAFIVEAFPFARRQMAFELDPLVSQLGSLNVPVFSSVRDILQPPKTEGRRLEVLARLKHFAGVLVHGDPAIAELGDRFHGAGDIGCPVWHTGLVAPQLPTGPSEATGPIIVSAGAGRIGETLFRCLCSPQVADAVGAHELLAVTGPDLPDRVRETLEASASNRIRFERFVSDFPEALQRTPLSISFAGYNTVADILSARCRAVLIGFTGTDTAHAGEEEQALRVERLISRFGFVGFLDHELSPERLAGAIREAFAMPIPNAESIALDGAARTVAIVEHTLLASGDQSA